jgi:hypothetical protein
MPRFSDEHSRLLGIAHCVFECHALAHTKFARVDVVMPLLVYLLSELLPFARTVALHSCALHAVTAAVLRIIIHSSRRIMHMFGKIASQVYRHTESYPTLSFIPSH